MCPRVSPINVRRRAAWIRVKFDGLAAAKRERAENPLEENYFFEREGSGARSSRKVGRVGSRRGDFALQSQVCTPPAYLPTYSRIARRDLPRKFKRSLANIVFTLLASGWQPVL